MNPILYNLHKFGDSRGSLIVLEGADIPFAIKRVYYLSGTKDGIRRGLHAHRTTVQIACSIRGSCKMLMDDGRSKDVICLNDPAVALLIEPYVWHEMFDFSDECILLVVASSPYDESDYIRSYKEFLREVHVHTSK